ncbi:hypothetical protein HUT19_40925 [Streptomyces sp. NA02950]|uniref:DUF5999 family protein n=1 Tax=Streptomyces sp. NA02950 TaxID=2742137 RepID=UPI0015915BD4|nr:DUF5999 family protein [Streptomyces sp. NA02950]QKV90417.1 hypothetical protein HUT19_00295 [Streptomyces sp. NA02950]QKV97250.1 hypothetical protein HUT19_40925 [Streptomyces sp. NA02950]
MCPHTPRCPAADATDADAAHPIAIRLEQGWTLLCNGVLLFDDTGEIRPDLEVVPPRRVATTAHGEKAAA